ncbi:MAG: PA0069 family radical SAM protein [Sphingomonadales bacterium]|jgi:DNA repair photolyase
MGQSPALLKQMSSPEYARAEAARRKDKRVRGRGALSNAQGRFEPHQISNFDDGWGTIEESEQSRRTHVSIDSSRSAITYNTSPDIPFDRSINAYRGCEHGCIYCFARPSHSFLGHSPGLDFEEKLYAKPEAPALLRKEISAPGYKVAPIALGTNTDPYQPIEQRFKITRGILEVLFEAKHPVTIVTKSHSITRDLDLLEAMAAHDLIKVALSVTTLDHRLARLMEPRASTPARRLDAIAALSKAGVKTAVMFAPVIPGLNDHEMEWVLAAAADAGALEANYITLRLPYEVKDLFQQWLRQHYPDRATKVMNILASMRGGKLNDPHFGNRMKGEGAYALMLAKRFRLTAKRYGLGARSGPINTASFTPQNSGPVQLSLL